MTKKAKDTLSSLIVGLLLAMFLVSIAVSYMMVIRAVLPPAFYNG